MALSVKRVTLWRAKVKDRPGALAEILEPVAAAGSDLQVVMGYRVSGNDVEATIELYPVSGRRLTEAVEGAGLTPSEIPTLLVSGDNKPGLAHAVARAIADAGINLMFLVAQVVGRKYSAVFGFHSDSDARLALKQIRRAATALRTSRLTS